MTWQKLMDRGRDCLQRATPALSPSEVSLEMQWLLSHLSGRSATWLVAHAEEPVHLDDGRDAPALVEAFLSKVEERAEGVPLAYLMGTAGFYGREFKVTPAVLVPRPETELLVEVAFEELKDRPVAEVLEIGTGSGMIACTLACMHPGITVTALDVSEAALEVAVVNVEQCGVKDRIRFRHLDVFDPLLREKLDSRFDMIISNPPYIPGAEVDRLMQAELKHEPRLALDGGADGLRFYRRLVELAGELLKKKGTIAVEIGYDQGTTVPDLFQKAGWTPSASTDLSGNARVVMAKKRNPDG